MKHEIIPHGAFQLIRLQENVDKGNSALFAQILERQLQAGTTKFIIDFTSVIFIDSSGIGALVRTYQALVPKAGKIILGGCNNNIRKIFKLIGFQQFFTITDTIQQALEIGKE